MREGTTGRESLAPSRRNQKGVVGPLHQAGAKYDPYVDRNVVLTLMRAASVVLVLVAIAAVALHLANSGDFDPTRFFAFFTIQSNLIGVAVFVWLIARRNKPRSRRFELLRGAAAVYLTVTFFVVIFLLSGADVQLDLAWVDFVVHKLFPVIVVLDWFLDPPVSRLAYRDVLVWLVYPLIWTGLTLVRGAVDGWYPYPFLDPANGGYGQVAVIVVAIIVGFLAVSAAIIAVGNWRSGRVSHERDPGLP